MRTSVKKRAGLAAWAAITALAVLYGPMAVEYMWRFFHPGSPGLWDHAFATVVDHDEAYGAGSIHAEKAAEYADHRVILLVHTTAGGVAIILFATQFSARLRQRLRRHRIVGRVAVSFALVGMLGAVAYLLAVGPDATYDGPGFYLQLWALAIGTALGVVLGFAAAVQRQIAMHQALMAYAFALLLTAPLLRVGYLLLGNAWPESTQLETNLAGAAFLATWAPLGAFLAARAMDHRVRPGAGIAPLPGRALDLTVLAVSLASVPVLAGDYGPLPAGLDRITLTGVVGMLAGLAVAVANLVAARRAEAVAAAEEWRIMVLSLIAGLPVTWLLWQVYDLPFGTADAYVGALLTGPAVALSAGYVAVTWRRRRPAARKMDPRERAQPALA